MSLPEVVKQGERGSRIVEIVQDIREGRYTKEKFQSSLHEKLAPGLTVAELIESSIDFQNVYWDGDVLRFLANKPSRP